MDFDSESISGPAKWTSERSLVHVLRGTMGRGPRWFGCCCAAFSWRLRSRIDLRESSRLFLPCMQWLRICRLLPGLGLDTGSSTWMNSNVLDMLQDVCRDSAGESGPNCCLF